jgi:site-specific DNA-cytosine methylase
MDEMNVLSLFDGCSCGQVALERANIPIKTYYASEVDKYAIQITEKNYPNTVQLGDVNDWKSWNLPTIDILLGGSPCQGFSMAGKRLDWEDPRSQLFFRYVDVLRFYKPKWFIYENVIVKASVRDAISKELGVDPIKINSALVSAQNRNRYYWTNIPGILQQKDKNILLRDIVLPNTVPVALHNLYGGFKEKSVRVFEGKSPTIRTSSGGGHIPSFVKEDLLHSQKAIDYMDRKVKGGRNHWDFGHPSDIRNPKSSAVVANFFKGVPYNVFKDWDVIRKFHPVECERLQTLPDNYSEGVSPTQRYKVLGNGWTVDVIAHILRSIK